MTLSAISAGNRATSGWHADKNPEKNFPSYKNGCNHPFNDPKLQPEQDKIPHMEHVIGRLHLTKPNKHPKLEIQVALCHDAYEEIALNTSIPEPDCG